MRFAAHHLTTPVTIYTDSLYSLNCMTTWGPSWKRKGWKRDSGEPLLNLDLIKPLVEIWALESKVRGWRVQHVRGHQTGSGPEVWGNNWVDRAAVAAAEGTPTDISLTAAAAAADTISHVEDDYVLARPSVPKPSVPKPSVPAKQADIRMWFGFSP
jgi:ribonuclease HI